MKRNLLTSSLLVAIAFGTAWAVRGKFGHEQGAAWAGGIGALAVLLVAKRSDWYPNAFRIAVASAVGWGIGGTISYGMVVGYGRGSDFINVYYGITMLFVIGALYGIIGGGLFGLALATSEGVKIKWHALVVEMTVLGLLTYGLLINQLEWFMTPPRSEMWAACLGGALAIIWYIVRLEQFKVLKIAIWSALGAGFGFASGNVVQVFGSSFHSPVNLWNVMEYSIGFWGGLGMAYGTFSSSWTILKEPPATRYNTVLIAFLMLFIPFVVWDQSFVSDKLESLLTKGGTPAWITAVKIVAIISILSMAAFAFRMDTRLKEASKAYSFGNIRGIFIAYFAVYILLSFLVTGTYVHPVEQYLYLINIAVFLWLTPTVTPKIGVNEDSPLAPLKAFILILIVLALSSTILIQSHGPLKGSQMRFDIKL